jgi:hypothetical protein
MGGRSNFRVAMPKYPTADSDYRIVAKQRSRYTHDYFYIRDPLLGPEVRTSAFYLFCLPGECRSSLSGAGRDGETETVTVISSFRCGRNS